MVWAQSVAKLNNHNQLRLKRNQSVSLDRVCSAGKSANVPSHTRRGELIVQYSTKASKSASGTDFAFENFCVRSLSCTCKTVAIFFAIEILLLPSYPTVVPFLYISHFPDLELSRFRVIGTASASHKYDKRCNKERKNTTKYSPVTVSSSYHKI